MAPSLYGLDIETDTTIDGLDPAVAPVVAVALAATDTGDTVFTGDERGIIAAVDAHLAALPAGLVVTWNGATFDLPFLADRARHLELQIGLELRLDPSIPLHRSPLAGHRGAYRARWHDHGHLDAYRAYRTLLAPDASGALKVVARANGFAPVEVDSAAVHELAINELRKYVTSDAVLASALARRRWDQVEAFVDPVAW